MIKSQLPMFPVYVVDGDVPLAYRSLHNAYRVGMQFDLDHKLKWRMRAGHEWDEEVSDILAGTWHRPTMVREIAAIPEHDAAQFNLAREPATDRGINPAVAVDALRDHIEATWRPGGKHVVLMSAGYDSRLCVALLWYLARRHGQGWLGETRIVCWEPECDDARNILNYIEPSGVGLMMIRRHAIDYDAPALAWDVCGQLSDPARFWGGPLLAELELWDWLDDDTQGLCALWSDELAGYWHHHHREPSRPLAAFLAAYMLDQSGVFPLHPRMEWIMPFVSVGYVTLLQHGTWRQQGRAFDDWKRALCEAALPGLSKLPNTRYRVKEMRAAHNGHLPTQELSGDTRAEMAAHYRESWYARNHGPREIVMPRYFDYVGEVVDHYLKAAIVERIKITHV